MDAWMKATDSRETAEPLELYAARTSGATGGAIT